MVEDVSRDAAQERLAPFAMGIGSHHEKIGAKFVRELQELRAHGAVMVRHGVGRGLDAVLGKDRRHHGFVNTRAQYMHGFGLCQDRHGVQHGFRSPRIVLPCDGNHAPELSLAFRRRDQHRVRRIE